MPSFFPLEAESLRKLPPVNLPSWAELRLRLITNATYEPDGHNPTRVVVLYGTGWCAIEMCRDFWWFPTKKGVITKNGRMGILFWTFVDMILLFIQCCAKNRLSSSLHWWNGFVEPERPWLVLHWGLLLSQWTQNTRTDGFLEDLIFGIFLIYHPGVYERSKKGILVLGWILRTTRSMESLQCQGHPTAAWCLIVL